MDAVQHSSYAETLMELFPTNPSRHLVCTDVYIDGSGGVKKRAITNNCAARVSDYAHHLSVESLSGCGALGVVPTFLAEFGDKESERDQIWVSSVLSIDYDSIGLSEIYPLVDVLEEYGVYLYVDSGTTGRGVHSYVFLTEPLAQSDAYAALSSIRNVSKGLGLPSPELFPSNASGYVKGIFLPYRAAEVDGMGANPLLDPTTGEILSLSTVISDIFRTTPESIAYFMEDLGVGKLEGTPSTATPDNLQSEVSTYDDVSKAWDAEVKRLQPEWYRGRRQSLALGLSAWGISQGIPRKRILGDVERLESLSDAPEIDKRLAAVERTVERYIQGKRIGWLNAYEDAELAPPPSKGFVPFAVKLKLLALEERLRDTPWKGMAGYTNRDVLGALIKLGRQYGKPHKSGVEISISVRDLALLAKAGKQTVMKAIKRLGEWVRREKWGEGLKSGSLVLLVSDKDLEAFEAKYENAVQPDTDVDHIRIPELRWGSGKLGKMCRPVLEAIQRLQPCTKQEAAADMGRKGKEIKDHLDRLVDRELILYDEEQRTYSLPEDFEQRLFEVLVNDGSLETDFKHKKWFERDREIFKLRRALYGKVSANPETLFDELASTKGSS